MHTNTHVTAGKHTQRLRGVSEEVVSICSLFLWFCVSMTAGFFIRNTTRSLHTVTYFENWKKKKKTQMLYVASVMFWLPPPAPLPPCILINLYIYKYILMNLRFPQSRRNQRRYRWRWTESRLIICSFERLCRFIPASPSSDVCLRRCLTQSEERRRGAFRYTSQTLKSSQLPHRIWGVVVVRSCEFRRLHHRLMSPSWCFSFSVIIKLAPGFQQLQLSDHVLCNSVVIFCNDMFNDM